MKPRTSTRPQARHRDVAEQLKKTPGTWGRVGVYPAPYSAKSTAATIGTGKHAAYTPAGRFETRCYPVDDGTAVDARYIGGEAA